NASTSNTGLNGNGMMSSQLPYMTRAIAGDNLVYDVITSGVNVRVFDDFGTLVERNFLLDTLVYDSTNHLYVFTDTAGDCLRFYDFTTTWPGNQRGQFKSDTDPYGNATTVTAHTSDGKVQEVQRSSTVGSTTIVESYLYSYIASGANAGLTQSVVLRRQVNGG